MRVLVTGGAGFIGSHIVDRCLKDGHEVTILDNFSHNALPFEAYLKVATVVRGEITSPDTVKQAMRGIDVVFHEAAQTNITNSIANPELTNEVNVQGTLVLLRIALDDGVKRFVYASSSAVYGLQEAPFTEGMVQSPISPYGVSKLAGECYCTAFHRTYGLPTVSLRYFNIFGEHQALEADGAVIPLFLNALKEKKPLTIHGDGQQTRDFLHVRDVVEANMLAATRSSAVGETFNIGSGKPTSILELSTILRSFNRSAPYPIHSPPRKGDVRHSIADTTKAAEVLGFNSTTCLEADLKQMLEVVPS